MAGLDLRRVELDGTVLEYQAVGAGEPVVLVHGALIADALTPLMREPALAERYRLIGYHRRGYAGSARPDRPLTIADQAADCRGVMNALGIDRAHVVGHSFGGLIALQLALDTPSMVGSLVLLEAALLAVPSAPRLFDALGPVVAIYQAGDRAGAVDAFMRAAVSPDYRGALDAAVAGGFDQAVGDAAIWFEQEMGAMQAWSFTAEDGRRIQHPALAVLGAGSAAVWAGWSEGYELVRQLLPQAEGLLVPDATHGLQMQNPRDLAAGMVAFLSRNRLAN
jgi:pimeloyl-ACP methyl ester carboxylesterase